MSKIAVVVSSTRQGRFADKVLGWLLPQLEAKTAFEVDVIDLRDHPLPFFDAGPPAYTDRPYADEESERLAQRLDEADGVLFLVAEYNHGYTGVLKNAMDHTFSEWNHKPAAFIGWGGVGGARAIEQLRNVVVEFEMAPLRHAVHILPDVLGPARNAEGAELAPLFQPLQSKLEALFEDLAWWTSALSAARHATV